MPPVIRTEHVTRVYPAAEPVHALRGIDLTVEAAEFVAIMGASGSGKSTLMNILGGLDRPTEGRYWLGGVDVRTLSKPEMADLRNQKLGFVFQGYNLLPRTSAQENVELPLMYDRKGRIENPREHARTALQRVGLGDRTDHEPSELSGGQQQRVAIARALVNDPEVVMADEPAGNLDTRTSMEIMTLFQALNAEGVTILLVTHEPEMARYARRIVELRDGRMIRDEPVADRRTAADDLEASDSVVGV